MQKKNRKQKIQKKKQKIKNQKKNIYAAKAIYVCVVSYAKITRACNSRRNKQKILVRVAPRPLRTRGCQPARVFNRVQAWFH